MVTKLVEHVLQKLWCYNNDICWFKSRLRHEVVEKNIILAMPSLRHGNKHSDRECCQKPVRCRHSRKMAKSVLGTNLTFELKLLGEKSRRAILHFVKHFLWHNFNSELLHHAP